MILVACHGPLPWGETAENAQYNSSVLKEIARIALSTEMIEADTVLLKHTLIDKLHRRKHGADAYYGQ
jgi:L-ribulose-5-phosphate 4-epimerase